MAEEDFWTLRERRKRELENQIAAIRGELYLREEELRAIFQSEEASPKGVRPVVVHGGGPQKSVPHEGELLRLSQNPTIKELIEKALRSGFPHGGNSQQIRKFILDGYGRDIQADSFRSQLARMKAQGLLVQNESTDHWILSTGRSVDKRSSPIERAIMETLDYQNYVSVLELQTILRGTFRLGVNEQAIEMCLGGMEMRGLVTRNSEGWKLIKYEKIAEGEQAAAQQEKNISFENFLASRKKE